jgi:hypothetical protein
MLRDVFSITHCMLLRSSSTQVAWFLTDLLTVNRGLELSSGHAGAMSQ